MTTQSLFDKPMQMALAAAEDYEGATAPNPPVGCMALDSKGKILIGAAHQKAGEAHAEARVLAMATKMGIADKIHTLVVTLEPCNHQGKTPPCTQAILKQKNIRQVVIGTLDPNPAVAGKGAELLKAKGLDVITGVLQKECDFLIRAFQKFSTRGLPYVTVKAAFTLEDSMIPPEGEKTFTSPSSLQLAHELRKKCDAIWTGSGTVLADNPLFTVRHVKDHPGKKRILALSDRRHRVSAEWKNQTSKNGFTLLDVNSLQEGLEELARQNVMHVLVEAGPTLHKAWIESGLWDEQVNIYQSEEEDDVEVLFRENS